ncbi:MAG: O-antigen ligase family protein [Myxococcales bacterium]|nr:O-antigen ligase family protein [Myxococcales bacterium]MCB9545949.1 O-antigen ligase family protein [Myxococcales bacterium]
MSNDSPDPAIKRRLGMDAPAAVAALGALALAPLLGIVIAGQATTVFAGVAAVTLGLFLLWQPLWCVYLMVVGALFNTFFVDAGFALLGAGDLAVLVSLPIWLLHRLNHPRDLRLPRAWPLLVAYAMLAGASLLEGVAPEAGIRSYVRQLTYVASLFAVTDLLRDTAQLRRIFLIFAVGGTFIAGHALATWQGGRLEGIAEQPNLLAVLLAFCGVPTIGIILTAGPSLKRLLGIGGLMLMIVALIFTISRGNYLGFGCAALWWMRRYRRLIVVAVLAAAGIVAVLARDPELAANITRRWQLQDVSVSQRIIVQENAIQTILQNPLFGVGFGQFSELHRKVDITAEVGRSAHNQYLGQMAATGIPAALLLFLFIALQFWPLWQRAGPFARFRPDEQWIVAVFQGLAIYQCVSMVFRTALRQPEWLMLSLYCAVLAIALARPEEAPKA